MRTGSRKLIRNQRGNRVSNHVSGCAIAHLLSLVFRKRTLCYAHAKPPIRRTAIGKRIFAPTPTGNCKQRCSTAFRYRNRLLGEFGFLSTVKGLYWKLVLFKLEPFLKYRNHRCSSKIPFQNSLSNLWYFRVTQ